MKRTGILAITAALSGLVAGASAQDAAPAPRPQVGTAVAAIVNDHPISTFDVQQRVRLLMATSGTQLSDEAVVQMQSQALRDLVEERLKLQEAERFELVIPEEKVDEEVARIAAGGGGTAEQLARDLAAQGIAIETLREKLRAEAAWEELVRGRYGSRVNVTDSEVEDMMADLKSKRQEEQFLIAEICLPLQDSSQTEEMRNVAMQMIGRMREGVPFRALAQQFSACPSAARGGDLGWMSLSEMPVAIRDVVPNLQQGNISLPVESDDMLVMVALRQTRDAAQAGEPAYEVVYAGAPKSVGRETAEAAFARLPATGACTGNPLSVDLGRDIGVTTLPMLPESQYQPIFRPELAALDRGEVSGLIEGEDAYHAVLLCQKDEGLGLPSRSAVQGQLRADELDRLSRRYLRDVERDSAVDIRLDG